MKPANVLLGTGGEVKVGDFGVARLAEGTSQAQTATVAGTPRYMSPEQARGRPTSAATDVYSAGVVLYEMLSGRPPFIEGSAVELGLRHLQDAPPPLPPETPEPLRRIVERSLSKNPSERYPDGNAMAAALHEVTFPAATTTVLPRPPASEPDGPPGVERRMPRAGAAHAGEGETIALASGSDGASTRVLPGGSIPPPPRQPANPAAHRRRRAIALILVGLLVLGAAIAVVLLGGSAAKTTVPNLRGLPRGGVEARARRLHVSPSFSRSHSEAPAGIAIAQSPAQGTRVTQGATVRVVLSDGPPPVAVPGVRGKTSASAEDLIANAGLRYSVTTVASPGTDPGVVVKQSPEPPATLPRGSTVALSIAETPRWRSLTTFSGIDDGKSVPFHILGTRWRVTYRMSYRGTCLLLVVCGGPSAEAVDLQKGSGAGSFDLSEGEAETHVFETGPGLYRILISGGRDSAALEDDGAGLLLIKRHPGGPPSRRQWARDHSILPRPGKPSAAAVGPVRSHSRPAM